MLTKEIIFESFRQLKTNEDRVNYLRWLQEQKTGLQINFERLIDYWSTAKNNQDYKNVISILSYKIGERHDRIPIQTTDSAS